MAEKCRCNELLAAALDWIYDHTEGDEYFGSERDTRMTEFAKRLKTVGLTCAEARKVLVEEYCYSEDDVSGVLDDIYEE